MYIKVDAPPLKVALDKLKKEFSDNFN